MSSAASVGTIVIVEQLGFLTSAPSQPRSSCWISISPRCPGLISGIVSGISGAMRSFEEFEETTYPASRNPGSILAATSDGSDEKIRSISSGTTDGSVSRICRLATNSGMSELSRHSTASRYVCPTLLSLAVTHVSSNVGCSSSNCTNRCPTAPVAPRIPT